MQKIYMVAPWEQYYGYDMACARFFTSQEDAERYCDLRREKDKSWDWDEYDVDVDVVDN
jgi:hypothetical protein